VIDAVRRIFISYAHDSPGHMAAVRTLHDLLRAEGLDATLDIFYDGPGQDWRLWMQRQLKSADHHWAPPSMW